MLFRRRPVGQAIQVLLYDHARQREPRRMRVQDRPSGLHTVVVTSSVLMRRGRRSVGVEHLEERRRNTVGQVVAEVGQGRIGRETFEVRNEGLKEELKLSGKPFRST